MKVRIVVLALSTLCLLAWGAGDAAVAPQQGVTVAPVSQEVVSSTDAITIPLMLNYQGKLTDPQGQPVRDSVYAVGFALFAVPVGGTPFWNEMQPVATQSGLFNVLLGSDNPILDLPTDGICFLAMAVDPDPPMAPRIRVVSAAYAYLAARADTANYAERAAAARPISPPIATSELEDTAVTMPKIARSGATTGQVIKWTGSDWAPRNDSIGSGGGDSAWTRVGSDSVLYTVRKLGIARGGAGNMLHGAYAFSHVNLGVACTTGTSGEANYGCLVGGGEGNTAGSDGAVVGGGGGNTASGAFAFVGGGHSDTASGNYAFVGGGWANTASGAFAFVGGGEDNDADTVYATVGGGGGNTASGYYAVVAGGDSNTASGPYTTVGGGRHNLADEDYATIPGGYGDTCSGGYALAAGYKTRIRTGGLHTFAFGEDCSTSVARAVVFYHSGAATKLGVGVQTPTHNIDVQGGAYCSGTNWVNGSSRALKTDITTLTPEQMEAVLRDLERTQVVNYRYKSEANGEQHIGLIAEDAPELLATPERDGINTADAIGFLMAAVKAQQAEIEALQTRLKRVER